MRARRGQQRHWHSASVRLPTICSKARCKGRSWHTRRQNYLNHLCTMKSHHTGRLPPVQSLSIQSRIQQVVTTTVGTIPNIGLCSFPFSSSVKVVAISSLSDSKGSSRNAPRGLRLSSTESSFPSTSSCLSGESVGVKSLLRQENRTLSEESF